MQHFFNGDSQHLFNFYGPDEIGAVSSVYSDWIEDREIKGNDSSVHEYHRHIAGWDIDVTMQQLITEQPKDLLDMLREYADETEQSVNGIMYNALREDEEDQEDHDDSNEAIPESSAATLEQMTQRYRFGHHAGVLALEVAAALEGKPVTSEDTE